MKAWMLVAALCLMPALAFAQGDIPYNLQQKYGAKTVTSKTASCSSENKSCTGWCDANSKTPSECKQECTYRINYCKQTGLYLQQTRPSVWVNSKD